MVDGAEALAVAVVEPSWTDYHVAYRIGIRHPLERSAAGRAILAGRVRATDPAAKPTRSTCSPAASRPAPAPAVPPPHSPA